ANDHAVQGSNRGAAYIFVRNGSNWNQQAKLIADDAQNFALFGNSVGISGDTAIVGAWGDDNAGGFDAGAAYIFVRNGGNWSQQAKLTALDADVDDRFGISVAISGDTAIVGAYFDDDNGNTAGAAYIFVRNGTIWSQQQKLLASDGGSNDLFGGSVAIDGETVIAAAENNEPPGGNNEGAVYVFVRNGVTWTQQQKLTASDAMAADQFGWSVGISGDFVVVGARFVDDVGLPVDDFAGAAYSFLRTGPTWNEQAKLIPNDVWEFVFGAEFGFSVGISSSHVIVGAIRDDRPGGLTDAGAAYVYEAIADASLPVELAAFAGSMTPDGIRLQWRTASETNNLGFHVYRSTAKDGNYVRITPALIRGHGTVATPYDYSFVDDTAVERQTYWYLIEDVDFSGVTERSDPIQVVITGKAVRLEVLPTQFALYQNYPNPFNPETWIPFQLSKAASVQISIYDSDGRRIRTIERGTQPIGTYITRDKAVYWDGRSDTGERVSSGAYFYYFRAGDYSATRKMIILK
ncbi:MAG: T9SS type A sorting domain-containing protein, partial [Candidatus Poribacteria bacterium]|nr:T9SS type A sorting domain-containing protein [Candidatus Poribacteria bacterium]